MASPPIPPAPAARLSLRRRRTLQTLLALTPAVAAACTGLPPRSAPEGASAKPPEPTPPPPPTPTEPQPTPAEPPPTPTPVPRSPFTGQQVDDGALLHRRIVAVKIDNAPDARPQVGMSQADLVFEELAEVGITRFMTFFLQNEPPAVGPVRSARPTDISLGKEWGFLLAYAGAGRALSRMLADSLIPLFKAPELGQRLDGTPYWRDPRRAVPHNMFVSIAAVREVASQDPGIAPVVEIRPLPFHEPPPDTGPLRTINMPYIPACAVTWRYDPEGNAWKRWMAGVPHVDALNGQQLQAENVLVQYAPHVLANVEPDSVGNPVFDAIVRGENTARLFHSGQVFEGTWSKDDDYAQTQFRLPDGTPLPFRPGKVWIHIVPLDFRASWA